MEYFRQRNITVIAASSDTIDHARDTVRLYRLSFTVCYGLDPMEISSKTGAFYSEEDRNLHAAGFIIEPGGRIFNGVYSTRSIGRLTAKDCIGLIDYSKK